MKPSPPSQRTQLALLDLIPTAPGRTTAEIGDLAQGVGLNVAMDPGYAALTIDGFPLHAALRSLRRNGWLFFNHHEDPARWVRTPTGTARLLENEAGFTVTPTFMEARA